MSILILVVFVLGYIFIATEHSIKIDKAASALITGMVCWAISVFIIIAGVKLRKRRNRMFCMVIGAIECMFMPLGTVLGVFTLIVLNKESIKQTYGQPIVEVSNETSDEVSQTLKKENYEK
jgi:glucan phosphoethanolaminetransferase (alkaline phosphatase superfamily)